MKVRKEEENTGNLYDAPPRYFVYAGLVFTPLTLDYVKTFGRNWRNVANLEMIYELYYMKNERPEKMRKEPVVLSATSPILPTLTYAWQVGPWWMKLMAKESNRSAT